MFQSFSLYVVGFKGGYMTAAVEDVTTILFTLDLADCCWLTRGTRVTVKTHPFFSENRIPTVPRLTGWHKSMPKSRGCVVALHQCISQILDIWRCSVCNRVHSFHGLVKRSWLPKTLSSSHLSPLDKRYAPWSYPQQPLPPTFCRKVQVPSLLPWSDWSAYGVPALEQGLKYPNGKIPFCAWYHFSSWLCGWHFWWGGMESGEMFKLNVSQILLNPSNLLSCIIPD